MDQKKRVLIIDDHPLFREGLKTIINRSNHYEIIGEAGTGNDGIRLAKKLKPDMVLADMSLPDQSGIDLIRDLTKLPFNIRIMVVSMHSKVDYIVKAFQAGAYGYVIKESAGDTLLEGMDQVFLGNYYMDTSVSQEIVKKMMGISVRETIETNSDYDSLTVREQEVMALLAEGLSIKRIADKLFISPKTVENHRSSIMRKLNLHSTLELVRYAAKLGLIDLDLWKK